VVEAGLERLLHQQLAVDDVLERLPAGRLAGQDLGAVDLGQHRMRLHRWQAVNNTISRKAERI